MSNENYFPKLDDGFRQPDIGGVERILKEVSIAELKADSDTATPLDFDPRDSEATEAVLAEQSRLASLYQVEAEQQALLDNLARYTVAIEEDSLRGTQALYDDDVRNKQIIQ